MGDNGELKKDEQKKPLKAHIFLGIEDDGNFVCNVNVDDIILGLGMLEAAKRMVIKHITDKQPKIVQPRSGIMDFVRRRR